MVSDALRNHEVTDEAHGQHQKVLQDLNTWYGREVMMFDWRETK